MPRIQKMKNNASSAVNNFTTFNAGDDDDISATFVLKSDQRMQNYLQERMEGPSAVGEGKINMDRNTEINHRQFAFNNDIKKLLSRSNFPPRFPTKLAEKYSVETVFLPEEGQELMLIGSTGSEMSVAFISFWNKMIAKKGPSSPSVGDHQLCETEGAYFPCQVSELFTDPKSYLKNEYLYKLVYNGQWCQLLPRLKSPDGTDKWYQGKLEIKGLLNHYSDESNHHFLIPIEFSSRLSRNLFRSGEIAKQSEACNKVCFKIRPQPISIDQIHPLLTIENRPSIELELLPSRSLSLINNYIIDPTTESQFLKRCFYNYPYLSHFLERSDFWVDDFYARCWHYSRFFTENLDFGKRIKNVTTTLAKDSIFKYLLACSARICVAVKYWVLHTEGATYFKCWCGENICDAEQERKLLKKMCVGSSELFNYQSSIRENQNFHKRHGDSKPSCHYCPCNSVFKDHNLWVDHILSPKIYDFSAICPIFIYLFSQQSIFNGKYVCECNEGYSDYDFWSFWVHVCNCKILKNALLSKCSCTRNTKKPKRSVASPVKRIPTSKTTKKVRNNRSRNLRSIEKIEQKKMSEGEGSDTVNECGTSLVEKEKDNGSENEVDPSEEYLDGGDDVWRAGDNAVSPSKLPRIPKLRSLPSRKRLHEDNLSDSEI